MSVPAISRDDRNLFAFAAACAALVFVVVAASAWLRLAAAPCPPGGCESFVLADAVRLAHRVAAMGVTIVALVIAAIAWKAPVRRARRVSAIAIVALVAALAIVGRGSAGSPPPAVVLANLLGGLTLLAATVGLAAAVRTPQGRLSAPFAAAGALLVVAIATGGVLAAAPPAESSALAFVHRAGSWVALGAWILLARSASLAPGARLAASLTAALLAAQVLLALVSSGWPAARWMHNVLTAAALCAAFAGAFAGKTIANGDPATPERAPAGS